MIFLVLAFLVGIDNHFTGVLIINCVISSLAGFQVHCQTLPSDDTVKCTRLNNGAKGFLISWSRIKVRCGAHTCPGYIGCEKCCDDFRHKEQFTSHSSLVITHPSSMKGKVFLSYPFCHPSLSAAYNKFYLSKEKSGKYSENSFFFNLTAI